jgi:hypothetical protein
MHQYCCNVSFILRIIFVEVKGVEVKDIGKVAPVLTKQHAMKTYGGVEVELHAFLTSALDVGKWVASRPGRFTPGETAPLYPLDKRLGGPQSRSGRGSEEKEVLPLPRIKSRSSSP